METLIMTPQKIQKTLSRVTLQAWSLVLLMTMVSVGRAAVFEKTDSAAEKQRKAARQRIIPKVRSTGR